MPRAISVGVIGVGGMGARHARNIYGCVVGAQVAAVFDRDIERASLVAAEHPPARVFDDPVQLIQSDDVDAVVIASPDETHVDFVLACLRSEKPVLCEKPLALTAAAAAKVVEAETALGQRLVAVGYMRRFDPQHVAVKQVVESGQIGRAMLFKGVHRNAGSKDHVPPEVVLTSSASHDIDAIRWLLRREIEQVYVQGVRTRTSFSEATRDLLLMQMVLSGNGLAALEVYVAAGYGYEVGAEVVGEHGSAATEQPSLAVVRLQQARSIAVETDWLARFQDAYVTELNEWGRSIHAGDRFSGASAWDGYVACLVTDACFESIRTGKVVPVTIPAMPGLYR